MVIPINRPRANHPPVVEATLHTGEFGRTWAINCPHCGEVHYHGAGLLDQDPRRFLGHRRAPCQPRGECLGYVLVCGDPVVEQADKQAADAAAGQGREGASE